MTYEEFKRNVEAWHPMAWQSIEAAPKDIDVLVVHRGYVFIARYVPAKTMLARHDVVDGWAEYDEAYDEYYCPAGWYRRNYCGNCNNNYSVLSENPTHWMPLPKPPFC